MRVLLRLIGLCAIIGLIMFGFTVFRENRSEAIAGEARPYQVDETALYTSLEEIMAANSKLDVSIAITDLQTGKRYHYGDHLRYGGASIGKLVSAVAYLRQIELGHARLEDQVSNLSGSEQLERMIIKSDNAAWHAINQLVTAEGLKTYAATIGLNSFDPADNLITASDTALLLAKLSGYLLLTNAHTDLLLSLLEQANMRNFIVAATDGKAEAFHKVGYLEDRLHDAAIIKRADRAYVLVIFSKSRGAYDFSKGGTLFRSITDSTLQAFLKQG